MTRRSAHALAGLAVAGVAFLYRFAPAEYPYPSCLFAKVTGWECPGCGSTRALYALLHLRIHEAVALNPLFALAFPFAALWAVVQYISVLHQGQTFSISLPKNASMAALAVALGFGLLRNLALGGIH